MKIKDVDKYQGYFSDSALEKTILLAAATGPERTLNISPPVCSITV
jgi:hypothetical protein